MGRPKGTTGKAEVLRPIEVRRLISATEARGVLGMRNALVLALSFYLGLRAKEIAAIEIRSVYGDDGRVRPVLHLEEAFTKGGRTRDVFLSHPKLRSRLEIYFRGLVSFPSTRRLIVSRSGKRFSANGMVQLINHLYQEMGHDRSSSHTGRRTMITSLAESGVDLKAISVIVGHRSVTTTAGYVQDNPERLSRICSSLGLDI